MNDLIYRNNNINEKKNYLKHKIYRKFSKRDKNREKQRYRNKLSSSNLEKKKLSYKIFVKNILIYSRILYEIVNTRTLIF